LLHDGAFDLQHRSVGIGIGDYGNGFEEFSRRVIAIVGYFNFG